MLDPRLLQQEVREDASASILLEGCTSMSSRAIAKVTDPVEAQSREIRMLSALLEASQALSTAVLDFKGGLEQVLEILCRQHGAIRSTAVLLAEGTREVELEASAGVADIREPRLTRLSAPIMLDDRTAGVLGLDLRLKAVRDYPRTVRFLGTMGTIIGRALKTHRLAMAERQRFMDEIVGLRQTLKERYDFANLIGASAPMRQVFRQMSHVAQGTGPLLLRGESGTGKELIARAIHYQSRRASKPFVTVGCGGQPQGLVEAELFGYERGGRTTVNGARPGRLEHAEGGTVFLDEVADLTPPTQLRLLRVLRDREFEHLGGTRSVRSNVRLMAGTSKDLERAVAAGRFLEDLYYRLSPVSIGVPPLRERRPDILLLANHFLERFSRECDKKVARISTAAVDALVGYHWPGNVQELADAVEHAVGVCDGPVIHMHHLPPTLQVLEASATGASLQQLLEAVEKDALTEALRSARGNRAKAARLLATTERIFNYRVRRYGIDWRRFKARPITGSASGSLVTRTSPERG